MKNIIGACLLMVSGGALAVTQTTSAFSNINFNLDSYVNIEILQKRVYMMLERQKKYDFNEHFIEVPITLEWSTEKGVSFTATCTSRTSSDLCKEHGLVKFPAVGMTAFDTVLYREGKTKTYLLDGEKYRTYKGQHRIRIGVSDVSDFIEDFGDKKENSFLYQINIEATI
ncbi:hypothetical protein AB6E21_16225 [Photobacterium swingsii]|uniref:hypothetical protein n=1 Tax=Photobacterium swingsii TaxID=680026 RepID=UPI00354BA70A